MNGVNLSTEELKKLGAAIRVISGRGGSRGTEQAINGGEQCPGVILLRANEGGVIPHLGSGKFVLIRPYI